MARVGDTCVSGENDGDPWVASMAVTSTTPMGSTCALNARSRGRDSGRHAPGRHL